MAPKPTVLRPIDVVPGVQPDTDMTAVSTNHYTYSDKIRDFNGKPKKIGGWISIIFEYGETISGYVRSIYSDFISGKYYLILGSNEKLYSLIGSRLTNITPFVTTPEAAANSISTHYATLANNPIEATLGSNFVWVQDTEAGLLEAGDTVTLSGATTVAGIPFGDLAGDFLVREIGVNKFKIYVATAATSTASGGGAAVVRTSGLITIASVGHGQLDGDRVKIDNAATTGGILDTEINREFIIRNSAANSFDVFTIGVANASVSAGGGASTEYFIEIPDGLVNETNAQGYGAGLYGIGLYGTALVSSASMAYPRIWFSDRYGDTITTTPGNQTGLYQWATNADVAPELIANAPTAINYQFVSNNIIVTFGAGGIENRIYASDQNNITVWTSSSTNQVYDDDIEGAGRLISHCPVKDYNLIFTEFKTYIFRYIGLPFVWQVTPLDETIGIIAPMARCSVNGMAFWMGQENFYFYRGGTIEIIPANSQYQSTCLKYVFDNLNWGQKSKIFAWYNKQFNEVWFHYPSAGSNEPNRVVRVNVITFAWWVDTMDRTAAEYPSVKLVNPRLINVGTLYQHEFGNDADGQPMDFSLTSNRRFYEKTTKNIVRIIPDSIQSGTITVDCKGYLFPQSTQAIYSESFPVIQTTQEIEQQNNGRFYEYTWSGSDLNQDWMMGTWLEEVQDGPSE